MTDQASAGIDRAAAGVDRASAGVDRASPGIRRLSALTFGLLVIASFAAFFVAQRLKHTPTAVQSFYIDEAFYPEGGRVPEKEAISFVLEHPDHVTVEIVDASTGTDVATLVHGKALAAFTPLQLTWNGRYGAHRDGTRRPTGPKAPSGEYRVKVILAQQQLTRYSATPFSLIRKGG